MITDNDEENNNDLSLKGYVVTLIDDAFNIMDNRFWTVPTYRLVRRVFEDISIDGVKGTDIFNRSVKGFCPDRKPIEGSDEFTVGCVDETGIMYSCSFHIDRSDMIKLMTTGCEYLISNPKWKGYGHRWLKAADFDPRWMKSADYESLCESDYDVALDIFMEWAELLDRQSTLNMVVFINTVNHPQTVSTKSN